MNSERSNFRSIKNSSNKITHQYITFHLEFINYIKRHNSYDLARFSRRTSLTARESDECPYFHENGGVSHAFWHIFPFPVAQCCDVDRHYVCSITLQAELRFGKSE